MTEFLISDGASYLSFTLALLSVCVWVVMSGIGHVGHNSLWRLTFSKLSYVRSHFGFLICGRSRFGALIG